MLEAETAELALELAEPVLELLGAADLLLLLLPLAALLAVALGGRLAPELALAALCREAEASRDLLPALLEDALCLRVAAPEAEELGQALALLLLPPLLLLQPLAARLALGG